VGWMDGCEDRRLQKGAGEWEGELRELWSGNEGESDTAVGRRREGGRRRRRRRRWIGRRNELDRLLPLLLPHPLEGGLDENTEEMRMYTTYRIIVYWSKGRKMNRADLSLPPPSLRQSNLPTFNSPNVKVRRRFQDFVFLHNNLVKDFPACIVPPLPDKHRLGESSLSSSPKRAHSHCGGGADRSLVSWWM